LEARGARMQEGLEKIFRQKGKTATVSRIGSAFCVYFADRIPSDWHDLSGIHDFAFDRRYRRALIDRGVYHFPLPCKQGSISAAHSAEDIDRTLERTHEALQAL
jgi:glutamate-1-semialdehyde 2,1-aminomutase